MEYNLAKCSKPWLCVVCWVSTTPVIPVCSGLATKPSKLTFNFWKGIDELHG